MTNTKLALGAVLTVLITVSACGSSGGTDASSSKTAAKMTAVKVTLGSDFHGAELPVMVGIEEGIYKKHGLDVTVEPNKGSSTALQTIGAGTYDLGWVDATATAIAVGAGIPVKVVGEMERESGYALLAYEPAGIRTAKDLEGKTGSLATGSTEENLFPAFAQLAHLDQKKVHFIKVSSTTTRNGLFTAKKVDFTFGLTNVTVPLVEAACNCKVDVVKYADSGFNTVSQSLVASNDMIKDHSDTVQKFVDATIEATKFAIANPDKAVDDLMKGAASRLTPVQTKEVVAAQWQETIPLIEHGDANESRIGCIDPAQFADTVKALADAGLVKPDLDAKTAYDTQFTESQCG